MITDKPPLQRIWSCLNAILCDASAAQDTCSEMIIDLSMFFWNLSPENGLRFIGDDPAEFEKEIQALETAAYSAAADLSDIHRYARLIRGALEEMRKETQND